MKIKIHRGTHQIGGCVTEYEYEGWHLFIDYGEELPGGPQTGDLPVEGLTYGDISKSVLLLTHYHGDHIGNITKLPKTLPIYMGKIAREIQMILSKHLQKVFPVHKDMVELLQHIKTFGEKCDFEIGPFHITPIPVDHSAFDAYAFKIEAGGVSVYHTGDFRLHGFRSKKFLKTIRQHVGEVDYVVCEATTISRPDTPSISERNLQRDFKSLFKKNKGCIIYLSSTNIDRLFSLYKAAQEAGRRFYVDKYQKDIMDVIDNSDSMWTHSKLYRYGKYKPTPLFYDKFNRNRFTITDRFKEALDKYGYVLIARPTQRFDHLIEQIPGEKKKVLSMWDGYVKEGTETYNANLAKSLDVDYDYMHTSGHIDMNDLQDFFRILQPKGIIPIHTEQPEAFAKTFSDEWPIILLNDGDFISPTSSNEMTNNS